MLESVPKGGVVRSKRWSRCGRGVGEQETGVLVLTARN